MSLSFAVVPALSLMIVIILTRSDLIRQIVAMLTHKPVMLAHEFEEWLFTVRYGFALHKLFTCSLCQAFHAAWVAALTLHFMGAPADKALASLSFGFLLGLAYLHFIFDSRQQPVPAAPQDPAKHESTEAAAKWKLPRIPFMQRLKASTKKDSAGGVSVEVTGMDAIAASATAILTRAQSCEHLPGAVDIIEAFEKELEFAVSAKCPKCEEGRIRRLHLDYIVALLEDDTP